MASGNSLMLNKLKESVAEKTRLIELLVGNLDLNLLSDMLKERGDLLRKLALLGEGEGGLTTFYRDIMARDAVVRARLSIVSGDLKRRIGDLKLKRNARRAYTSGT
jgi:hypothetical protein